MTFIYLQNNIEALLPSATRDPVCHLLLQDQLKAALHVDEFARLLDDNATSSALKRSQKGKFWHWK